MSLEASIAELNSNIKVLIGVLNKAGSIQPAATEPAATGKPATPQPEKTAPKEPAQAAAPTQPSGALDYTKDVQPVVLQLSAKKGRDAAIAVLAKFGLKSAKDAKPEQYQQLIDACQEAIK